MRASFAAWWTDHSPDAELLEIFIVHLQMQMTLQFLKQENNMMVKLPNPEPRHANHILSSPVPPTYGWK